MNTFAMLLNSSSNFFWNMSPTGAALKGYLVYLYMLNEQENVKYDGMSSNLRL